MREGDRRRGTARRRGLRERLVGVGTCCGSADDAALDEGSCTVGTMSMYSPPEMPIVSGVSSKPMSTPRSGCVLLPP
jgi:hypothetical protein